jgi:Stress responsive A/B Barrel Domain
LVELENSGEYPSIRRDADSMLGTIPSVATYAAGGHLETGRSTVSDDYDLAIYLGFASQADLAVYVAHEQHIAFVKKWKPRFKSLRVYDMLDEPPRTILLR